MSNVLAIIGAALLVKLGENLPKSNGHGKLIKNEKTKNKTVLMMKKLKRIVQILILHK